MMLKQTYWLMIGNVNFSLPVNANHRQDGNQDSVWIEAGIKYHKIFC